MFESLKEMVGITWTGCKLRSLNSCVWKSQLFCIGFLIACWEIQNLQIELPLNLGNFATCLAA